MRRFTVLGFCFFVVALAFIAPSSADVSLGEIEMHVPMGTITLQPPSSVEPKRANVKFPHAQHFIEVSCHTCHHDWNAKNPVQGCMASGCHDSDVSCYEKLLPRNNETGKKITKGLYYKEAYHSQCIGCHKTLKEKSKKIENSKIINNINIQSSGPTGCVECHPKQ